MFRGGVPLQEIGQVLRHRDATSTGIYARVDIDQLRTVARPWPQGANAVSNMRTHLEDYLRLHGAMADSSDWRHQLDAFWPSSPLSPGMLQAAATPMICPPPTAVSTT
jgi:hypothetical protein